MHVRWFLGADVVTRVEVFVNRSFAIVSGLALLSSSVGCESSRQNDPAYGQQPGYGQQQQYPQQQYPQQQYPQQQYPQQQYPQQQQPQQQQPQQQPQQQQGGIPGFPFPIPGFPTTGGTTGQTGTTGSTTASAQQIDPNLATAATVPLMQLQLTHAKGMQKEGPILAGNFQQGQSLEQAVQLMPNKCYTIIGTSAGVQELDIQLVVLTPLPGQSPAVASDNQTGATAIVGGSGSCFRWQAPFGANAKWIMTARTGGGLAAGQLYVK